MAGSKRLQELAKRKNNLWAAEECKQSVVGVELTVLCFSS